MAAGNTAAGTGTLALVGPGRAGTTLTLALLELGWEAVAVAGRAPDAPSTQAAAACLGAPTSLVSDAGRGATLVIVATPDRAISAAALAVGPSPEPAAPVLHLPGSVGLEAFAPLPPLPADPP